MKTLLLLLVLVAAYALPTKAQTSAPDSLMKVLQGEDLEFFDPDLFVFPSARRDSIFAAWDSVGYKDMRKAQDAATRVFRWNLSQARHLGSFNRTEGFVGGLGLELLPTGRNGPRISGELGRASGPGKWRHYEQLVIPLKVTRNHRFAIWGQYSDRVVPFGSNRVTANGLRALVGGEDEQDYLHWKGGLVGATWTLRRQGFFRLYGASGRQWAVMANEDYSLFGRLEQLNAPIDEGRRQSVFGHLEFNRLGGYPWEVALTHGVHGGALGGDFDYNRTDLQLSYRQYFGEQEFALDLSGVQVSGFAPQQSLADIGGLSTVRGFPRRFALGDQSVSGRLEYLIPYDIFARAKIPLLKDLKIQFVPWADAGRVFEGTNDNWLTSAGLGVQAFIGPFSDYSFLRLDLAAPLGSERRDDVVFYLRFGKGLF